jgi:hypothetical protein
MKGFYMDKKSNPVHVASNGQFNAVNDAEYHSTIPNAENRISKAQTVNTVITSSKQIVCKPSITRVLPLVKSILTPQDTTLWHFKGQKEEYRKAATSETLGLLSVIIPLILGLITFILFSILAPAIGLAVILVIIAGIFLIVVVAVILGLLAIILGIIAEKKITDNRDKYFGEGEAIAGIILGILAILLAILALSIIHF